MRDYSKTSSTFWTGETGRALRGDTAAQLIALYLITCPSSNMIGLYYIPLPQICHETGLSRQGALKGLRRVIEVGFAAYDFKTEHVFVFEMAHHQLGDSLHPKDNRRKGVIKLLYGLFKSPFYNDFLQKYSEVFSLGLQFSPEGASKGLRSKEKEQEKEKEKEREEGAADAASLENGSGKAFQKPTVEEVRAYCLERKNGIDPEHFVSFYESKNWFVGKNKMTSWKHAVITWEKREPKIAQPLTDEELENYRPGDYGS